jgi:cobalt-zinc-cadmium efflux system protein
LLADAGHNLGDVAGLCLAWGAGMLAQRWPTLRYTYGLRRSTILASLANAIFCSSQSAGSLGRRSAVLGITRESRE